MKAMMWITGIFLALWVGTLLYSMQSCHQLFKTVENQGLKNVLEEVWEGPDHKPVDK